MGKKNNCWGYCWTIEQMGIWKSVGKESNAQNGISSKKKKKKKRGNGEGCTREKDEKEENEISPTNIMIMLQNLLLFL